MKRLMLATILTACFAVVAQADTCAVCYPNYKQIDECIWDTPLGSWNDDVCWTHDNPFPGDYEAALEDGVICGVTLKINACLDECDDVVKIKFWDAAGNPHPLGYLQNGDTCFDLDPEWLDTVGVKATIEYERDFRCDLLDLAKINWSELKVCAVPVPGAVLLGVLGLVAAGRKLRSLC